MKKIVVIGGGSGLHRQLQAIKKIEDIKLDVVITVADDGGSTGKLRKDFKIPAVGDIRNVMSALADEKHELQSMLNYRFEKKLEKHSLGNIMLTSLIDITQDFNKGVREMSKILRIKGTIHPLTSDGENEISAEYNDGEIISGESKIPNDQKTIERVFYKKEPAINKDVLRVISEADYIIFGIGSLYTSLIANLCHSKVSEAIKKSSAKVIYFMNLFQQTGETHGMTDVEHVEAIEKHIKKDIIDILIINNGKFSKKIIDAYNEENQPLVHNHKFIKKLLSAKIIKTDLIEINKDKKVRHSIDKMIEVLNTIL